MAVVGLILTAPLMLLIAALIKATSRGPVIFSQPRVGVDRRGRADPRNGDRRTIDSRRRGGVTASSGGRRSHEGRERRDEDRRASDRGGAIFTIHKFRTMRTEDDSAQVWARKDDSRITPLGRVLRATRLDELPQLFNVLRGNMNVVGPRPEQPEIFAELSEELGHYRQRQRVLPGITGLAQVNLGYDQTIDDVRRKVDLDLEYIRRRSAFEDLKIMAQTMPVMVFQKVWM